MAAKENIAEASRALIERLRKGDPTALKEVYAASRPRFLAWARPSGLNEEDLLDVFQDSVIILYRNIATGKITSLESSTETYLFGIAKNLLMKKWKTKGNFAGLEKLDDTTLGKSDMGIYHQIELSHRQQVFSTLIDSLGSVCKAILRLFYYESFSLDSIAERLGYENESVVRTQKSRCLAKLREGYLNSHT